MNTSTVNLEPVNMPAGLYAGPAQEECYIVVRNEDYCIEFSPKLSRALKLSADNHTVHLSPIKGQPQLWALFVGPKGFGKPLGNFPNRPGRFKFKSKQIAAELLAAYNPRKGIKSVRFYVNTKPMGKYTCHLEAESHTIPVYAILGPSLK